MRPLQQGCGVFLQPHPTAGGGRRVGFDQGWGLLMKVNERESGTRREVVTALDLGI